MQSSDPRTQCPCAGQDVTVQGEKVERGERRVQLCVQWVRQGLSAASCLDEGCRKVGEGSGIWETTFEWEVEAGPCLFFYHSGG